MVSEVMITFPFPLTMTNPTDVDAPLCALTSIVVSDRVDDRHSNTDCRLPMDELIDTIIDENELTHPSLTIRPSTNTPDGVSPTACRIVVGSETNTFTLPDVRDTLSSSE